MIWRKYYWLQLEVCRYRSHSQADSRLWHEQTPHSRQFGTVPGLNTTEALISMLHSRNCSTDGNGATVRVVLFDFKKAFDLIDHHILVWKLHSFALSEAVVSWIIDFSHLSQTACKVGPRCFSEWGVVPAGVPQETLVHSCLPSWSMPSTFRT